MPINLSKISASTVGNYAACPQRLVYDSQFDRPWEDKPAAAFGTVCHYFTQFELQCAPEKEPDDATIESAKRTGFVRKPESEFMDAVMACAKKAASSLPPLKPGVTWVSESKHYDRSLLPERRSRKGEPGFGGDVDLLMSDRSELWDLKFVGQRPDYVAVDYVWQLGSYHIAAKVPKTGILFVTRDAQWAGAMQIDWSLPIWVEMVKYMRGAIEWMGHANFERHAYPVEGSHCKFCDHKHRCPVKQVPMIMNKSSAPTLAGDPGWLERLRVKSQGSIL